MSRTFLVAGALFGAAGVVLGAFGAHSLRAVLDTRAMEVWETAVFYQMIHAIALLISGVVVREVRTTALRSAGIAFGLGIVLFSGSLYALALGGPPLLGPLTPIGGLCFIVGWCALAWSQRPQRAR